MVCVVLIYSDETLMDCSYYEELDVISRAFTRQGSIAQLKKRFGLASQKREASGRDLNQVLHTHKFSLPSCYFDRSTSIRTTHPVHTPISVLHTFITVRQDSLFHSLFLGATTHLQWRLAPMGRRVLTPQVHYLL